MEIVVYLVIAAVSALLALQWVFRYRMRRLIGRRVEGAGHDETGAQAVSKRLYYFFSPNCGPCRTMSPIVDRLAQRHAGVIKVDISTDLETARRFGVMGTPTTLLVKEDRIAEVLVGPQSEHRLEDLLKD